MRDKIRDMEAPFYQLRATGKDAHGRKYAVTMKCSKEPFDLKKDCAVWTDDVARTRMVKRFDEQLTSYAPSGQTVRAEKLELGDGVLSDEEGIGFVVLKTYRVF